MAERDMGWVGLTQPWQRLAWARSTQTKYSQDEFGKRVLGYKSNAYGFHEREPEENAKVAKLTMEKAKAWAPHLNVRWEWLHDGTGEPWPAEPAETDAAWQELQRLFEQAAPDDRELLLANARRMVRTR